MRTDPYRIFGWVIPIFCMIIALVVLNRQRNEFNQAQQRHDAASLELAAANEEKAEADKQMLEDRYAAAETTPFEETAFLTDLRQRVADSGAAIDHWTSTITPLGTTASDPSSGEGGETADQKLLKGITKISSTLALTGSYSSLRNFIEGVTTSKRLLTLSSVNWSRDKKGTALTVTLNRYVAPAQVPLNTTNPNTNAPATVTSN